MSNDAGITQVYPFTPRSATFEYWGEIQTHSDGGLTVRTSDPPAIFRGEERKRLASLALDGQTFGFTPDDVEALLKTESMLAGSGWGTQRLHSIAARIAALLPPSPHRRDE